ncbi:protein phosphatase 2C domain-containing protein [Breznakiellaceae bacterium SP9]
MMIYAYGITLQGLDHALHGVECQDAHKIAALADDYAVAAVADGLGSELYSGTASKIAADTAVDYCSRTIKAGMTDQAVQREIRASFCEAWRTVEDKAQENHHGIDQYDTTLSLAVYMKDTLHFGHSGDSGILALAVDGLYEPVTKQQRDENGYVFPLCCEDRWVFGTFPKKAASVFLATDGIYDTLFPLYIREEPVNIHISLARYFMDNEKLGIDTLGTEEIQKKREDFLRKIPRSQVGDDKTVVCLINTSIASERRDPVYYAEPDWDRLKQKWDAAWNKKAYPSLYQ